MQTPSYTVSKNKDAIMVVRKGHRVKADLKFRQLKGKDQIYNKETKIWVNTNGPKGKSLIQNARAANAGTKKKPKTKAAKKPNTTMEALRTLKGLLKIMQQRLLGAPEAEAVLAEVAARVTAAEALPAQRSAAPAADADSSKPADNALLPLSEAALKKKARKAEMRNDRNRKKYRGIWYALSRASDDGSPIYVPIEKA